MKSSQDVSKQILTISRLFVLVPNDFKWFQIVQHGCNIGINQQTWICEHYLQSIHTYKHERLKTQIKILRHMWCVCHSGYNVTEVKSYDLPHE